VLLRNGKVLVTAAAEQRRPRVSGAV
jgi:hypothetical protein